MPRPQQASRHSSLHAPLPAALQACLHGTHHDPRPCLPGGPLRAERSPGFRILLVDDHRESADAMSAKLGLLGNTVFTTYDGWSAIEAHASWRPEVLILDLGMPGMDGYAVARHIRATPAGRHALLIALTGMNSREDRRLSVECGIDHHSTKPVDAIILQRIIEVRFGQARKETRRRSESHRTDPDLWTMADDEDDCDAGILNAPCDREHWPG